MNEFLTRLIQAREAEITQLRAASDAATDIEEVRGYSVAIETLTSELREAEAQLAALQEEDALAQAAEETRAQTPASGSFDPARASTGASTASRGNQHESLGAFVVRSLEEQLRERRGRQFSVSAPEFELRDDQGPAPETLLTGGPFGTLSGLLTMIRPDVVEGYRRPTISDLFAWEPVSTSAVTYYVEGAVQGSAGTTAEGANANQVSFDKPTPITDPIQKVTAMIKVSDEYLSDLPRLAARINNRLLYLLALAEENQLLYGDGEGTNIKGLTLRSGIQTYTPEGKETNAEAIFHARTLVSTSMGSAADGVVINDWDYEGIRLSKTTDGFYYAGGPFAGAIDPPLWGIPTIVTPAVAELKTIVGAFALGATAYRNGGITVQVANQNQDDFERGLLTILAQTRIGLAVERPVGFCLLSLKEAAKEEGDG
jgi:hypothetical protein